MPTPRLIVLMSVSLDGFVARPDHVIDWLTPAHAAADRGAERHRANLELLGQAAAIVVGRRAHDDMASAWASSDSPMARVINALPKVVFSAGLDASPWGDAEFARGPVEEEIPALKQRVDGDIVCFGGARLANSLARHRLVDEYRLVVHPVALGEGLPLLHGLPEPQRFELVSSTTWGDGAITQVLAARAA